ncbi:hypothetical protein EI555_006299 [Monodon monoceros]|uniref:Uncharacterized protein n=1 Tax=Monodon monoceros TaxID=40151 RepID=A0A4U1F764_MONMO|nr:hypothetical protein EI555_006299 [Monodon monoceros]
MSDISWRDVELTTLEPRLDPKGLHLLAPHPSSGAT